MWSNQKSAKIVVDSALRATPPYCANPECSWHDPGRANLEGRFARYGTRKIGRYPYVSVRFRCYRCRKTFSDSFFKLEYRDRQPSTYEEIFTLLNRGWTKLDAAEFLGVSLDTVIRRTRKMARQALLQQTKLRGDAKICESVAFDGLENFSYSQFDPNNVNHAVGRETYFLYDFNLSPMNRKGRMSNYQVKKKEDLEKKHGRYDGRSIEKASKVLFERLVERSEGELELHTDNHYAYRRALKLIGQDRVTHLITPAKVCRNFRNRLFAINHVDNLTRQKCAPFKRETISFAKHTISMLETFTLFMVNKNFMRPIFKKKQKRDPAANRDSPAMRAGFTAKKLKFHEFFSVRVTKAQVKLNEDWLRIFERLDESSRRPIRGYAGI